MQLKYIGTITSIKGLDGSMILSDIDTGIKEIEPNTEVYIGFSENFTSKYSVRSFHKLGFHSMISLNEISNPEDAEKLKEAGIFISKIELNKSQINVLKDELIGVKVYNIDNNEYLGEITDIWDLPSGEVWIVSGAKDEYTIPAVDEFIKSYDKRKKTIKVKLIEGLKNLNSNDE